MAYSRADGVSLWRVACVYAGAVIGAGFASGREVWIFFVRYGPFGAVGLATAAVLFCLLAPILMRTMRANSLSQYGDLYRRYLPQSTALFIDTITTLYMFGVLSVMFTGSVSLASRTTGMSHLVATFLVVAVLIAIASPGMRRIANASLVLSPVLVAGLSLLCLDHLLQLGLPNVTRLSQPLSPVSGLAATASSLVYVSYNMLMCLGVFASLASSKSDTTSLTLGGVLGGTVLGVLGALVFAALASVPDWIADADMPLLMISRRRGGLVHAVYTVAVWAAMITTALSMLISLTARLSALDRPFLCHSSRRVSILLTLLCVPISYVGFAPLMDRVYLLFGVLGLAILALVLRSGHSFANR